MADKIVQLIDKDGDNIFPVAVMPMTNYSTVEQDTGMTWVDGRNIYKKTVDTGRLPNNSTKGVAHGITNLRRIVHLEGIAYRSTDDTFAPLPFVAGGLIYLLANATNIQITTTSDRTAFLESYVTLYYTKSS